MQQPGFLIHITTHCTLSNLGSFGKAPVAMISACGDDTGCYTRALAENTWAMMSACGDDTGGRLYRLVFTFLRFSLFAHNRSLQMTLRYAQLYDSTKRQQYDEAMERIALRQVALRR